MKQYIKKFLYALALVFIFLCSLLSFLTLTTPGLYCVLSLAGLYAKHPLQIQGLKGNLMDEFSIATVRLHQGQTELVFNNLKLRWHIESIGTLQIRIHALSADAVEIKQKQHTQRMNTIHIQGTLKKHLVHIDSLTAQAFNQKINASIDLDISPPYKINSTIKMIPVKKGLLTGLIHLHGNPDLLTWDASITKPAQASIHGQLKQGAHIEQSIIWNNLVWPSKQNLISPKGRINMKGRPSQMSIELNATVAQKSQEPWQLKAHIAGAYPYSWNIDALAALPAHSAPMKPGFYTTLQLTGQLKDKDNGALTLKVNPGRYQMQEEHPGSSIGFKGGTITAELSAKELLGQGAIAIDDQKKLNIRFLLPEFHLLEGLKDNQRISTDIQLNISSLDFLNTLTPEIKHIKGHMTAALTSHGTLQKSTVKSSLALHDAGMDVPVLGLNLQAINATFKGSHNRWQGEGSMQSGTKTLRLTAQGLLRPQYTGSFFLEGDDVPFIHTKEYSVNISPRLKIGFNKNTWSLNGDILVPCAQIKIFSFSNSVGLSSDVVFKSKSKALPLATQMDLNISMGQAVELSAKGLHATLAGTVHLKQNAQSPLNATGELTVVKGQYKAYGQNLTIEQGELLFTGGGLDNPGINLRAVKNIDTSSSASNNSGLFDFKNNATQSPITQGNMSVGVEVSGRLIDPEIQLFSNPSTLSQADILSMLVLGRPANQANKAGGQLLLAAISSMNLNNATKGTQLLEQLKQSLGIDFNVETNSNYNILTNTVSDKTAIVVSKSLSKRISLSYNVGLSQADPNVVSLKYLLNKWFSIQVSNTNNSNGIDVLYNCCRAMNIEESS